MMLYLCLFSLMTGHAAALRTLDPVGAHYPIVTFEKSENPQNIMIIYTKLDAKCHVLPDPDTSDKPFFNFYWLMDGTRYKKVHPMISSGIRDRMQVESLKPTGFAVAVNDLKELKTDLKDPHLQVSATQQKGACEVEATMKLGPSDKDKVIRINTIYSTSRKTFWPPFRKVTSITLKGVNVANNEKVERTYSAPKED